MKIPFAGKLPAILRRSASHAIDLAGAAAGKAGRGLTALVTPSVTPEPPAAEPAPPPPPVPDPARVHIAARPQGLSLYGWWEVLQLLYWETFRDRLMLVAAGVAFYVMLSIFPALSALIWFYGLFADPAQIVSHIQNLAFLLPAGALDIIQQQAISIASTGRSSMNTLIIVSTLLAMWSANAGMKAMFEAMNIIYAEDEKRGFIALNIRSMLFTLGALAIFVATLAVLVLIPLLLAYVSLEGTFARAFIVMRWPLLYVITVVYLIFLNRYGPSRPPQHARWALWGSALGAALWLAVSVAFSWYVEHLGNLAATYGSIAAIAGLMLWLWLSSLVILIGFELNNELELRTSRWEVEERHRQDMEDWQRRNAQQPARTEKPSGGISRFWRRRDV